LALAICGTEAGAFTVVEDVLRTLPSRVRKPEDRAARLEVVAITAELAALHVFDPSDLRGCGLTIVDLRDDPPSKESRVLAMAFARRLSWYSQAALWAVDVEGLNAKATERRLGTGGVRVRLDNARTELRRAYVQLRRDLDQACVSDLRRIFLLEPDAAAAAPHPAACPDCMAQREWLGDLGVALRTLGSPVPLRIWETIKAAKATELAVAPPPRADHPVASRERVERPVAPPERVERPIAPPPRADQSVAAPRGSEDERRRTRRGRGSHALRSGSPPRQDTSSATMPRGRRAHAVGSKAATERSKSSGGVAEPSVPPVFSQDATLAAPAAARLPPPPPDTAPLRQSLGEPTRRGSTPVNGTVRTDSLLGGASQGTSRPGGQDLASVQAGVPGPSPHLRDSSPPCPADTAPAWSSPAAVVPPAVVPPVAPTTRARRSPNGATVAIPPEAGMPTEQADDRPTITLPDSRGAVTTSSPSA